MLRLQLPTGEFLIQAPDTTITMELVSTLFNNSDTFAGSYSYPIKLPLEPNRALIRNAHFISSSNSLRKLNVLAWLGNRPWKQVVFQFDIEETWIDGNIKIDNGIVNNTLSTRKLTDVTGSGTISLESYTVQKIHMKKTAEAEPGVYSHVFFPFKNPRAFKDVAPDQYADYPNISFPISPYINNWKIVSGSGEFVTSTDASVKSLTAPSFYLTYVIKRVLEYLKYSYEGEWLDNEHISRLVILSPIILNPSYTNQIADMSSYMPSIGLNEFFKKLRNRFNLLIEFDQTRKVCLIESWDTILNSTDGINLQDKQLKGIKQTSTNVSGFSVHEKVDSKDEMYKDAQGNTVDLPLFTIADAGSKVELDLSTTKMVTEYSPSYDITPLRWRIPYIKRPMYSADTRLTELLEQDKPGDYEMRILYYHGMVEDESGYLYPYASADNLDFDGNPLVPDFSLTYIDDDKTPNSLRDYYDARTSSKKIEVNFLLTKEDFFNLKISKKVFIRDFNNASVTCLIDKIAPEIGRKDKIVAKATLYAMLLENNITGAAIPVAPPVENGVVYARIFSNNRRLEQGNHEASSYSLYIEDVYVQFFADAAGTIPKEVTQLTVRWRANVTFFPEGYSRVDNYTNVCTGTTVLLHQDFHMEYWESPEGAGETPLSYSKTLALQTTADYNVIT